MKIQIQLICTAAIASIPTAVWGFSPPSFGRSVRMSSSKTSRLYDTEESSSAVDVPISLAKAELLGTANRLKEKYGVLIIDGPAQEELKEAVEKLEMACNNPSTDVDNLMGEWTLVCSTATPDFKGIGPLESVKGGIDTSKLPFFNEGPLKDIRTLLNKSLQVQQVIKSKNSDGLDRIDHVLEYSPPDKLSDFLNSIPDPLKSLNINPLQVTKSKVVLAHKAEVETTVPVIKTKLSLESVIVNIAGKSQNLDPKGADVLGVNVPLGEFLNAGSFETTYMDDELRISRSKVGVVDQLRVFLRTDVVDMDKADQEGEDLFYESAMSQEMMDDIAMDSEPSDVELEPEVDTDDENDDMPSDVN